MTLPGMANREPVPVRIRIIAVTRAMITVGIGPSRMAPMTLMACCIGYARAIPVGIETKVEPAMQLPLIRP